ncbi:aldose epimerase family protein [Macrococcus sp. EM39E]|uniref:aldose epimerase family protein n=1 Tax=Macrococcus animalis TaxID=3395467 RepID=UPI0039BDB57C
MTKHLFKRYSIENNNGIAIELSDLGATITKILVPKNNQRYDVVLGFDDDSAYFDYPTCYFGGIIGRVANRIAKGTFELNDERYHIETNEGNNTLHSGNDGYQLRRWEVVSSASSTITFKLVSPHLDQGFPGELKLAVTYTITDDNALTITYHGESDRPTVFNPTNHSYFNLNGHDSGSVMKHRLWIDSRQYSVLDNESIPKGHADVLNTPMDFSTESVIGEQQASGFDDNYILNHRSANKVATLIGDQTGIAMDVFTDMPCVQLYTGNGLDNVPGKDGVIYDQFAGVCLETQFEPNSVNSESPPLIDGEKIYRTVYQFRNL